MQTVLLIRHGESLSNAGLPTSSPKTVALTELGKEQAECIAEYLKSQFSPDLIVTSSYQRSKQTAKPTMLSFPYVPQEEWPVQEFTFLSLDLNKRRSTADERRPFVEKYWKNSKPLYVHGPGAESFQQFIKRTRKVIKYLKYTKNHTIIIFSHIQFICAILWLLQRDRVNLSQETMQQFRSFLRENLLANGAIVRMQFDDNDGRWHYKIITSHLEELEEQKKLKEQKNLKELELVN